MKQIEAVYSAYSNRDDAALAVALKGLVDTLSRDVLLLGPAAVSLRLRAHPGLPGVIDKVVTDAGQVPAVELAYFCGRIIAYMEYLDWIVDRETVDSAGARLPVESDDPVSSNLVQMILKTTFAHSGAYTQDIFSGIARSANVPESMVKRYVLKLVRLKMLERLKDGRKTVAYRISRLGELVLARRLKQYELALFFVDDAARDASLRVAMQNEIQRTWPK